MLLSLIKPTEGSIEIFGKDLLNERNFILSKIGCIVEKPDFYKYLSAKKNLELLAGVSGVAVNAKKIDELLEFVGLSGRGNDFVKTYSHGMKQRLGLAQALLHDPELIILDEPTTGLDPQGIIDIRNLILYLSKEKGKTVFLSSHILSEMELIATRLAIINKGKTVAQGELNVLLNDDNRVVRLKVSSPEKVKILIADTSWMDKFIGDENGDFTFHLHYNEIPELNKFLMYNDIEVYSIESRRQLEDYFLKLTESSERMMGH
jgi:ABC-type multidrug transport system ATPase subunit